MTWRAVAEMVPASARRTSSSTPRSNIWWARWTMRFPSRSLGTSRPKTTVGMPDVLGPELVCHGYERASRLGQLERANDSLPVVCVNARRGARIAVAEHRMGPFRAESLVEVLDPLACSRRRRGRQLELGEGRAQIETRSPDHHGSPRGRASLVDDVVGQRRVLADRCLVVELPDPDEPRRLLRLVRQDRKPPVRLHRVGRHELRRDPFGNRARDRALSGRGGAEDPDHGKVGPTVAQFALRSGHPNPPPAFDRSRENRACGARTVSRVCLAVSRQPRARSRCPEASSTSHLRCERRPAAPRGPCRGS